MIPLGMRPSVLPNLSMSRMSSTTINPRRIQIRVLPNQREPINANASATLATLSNPLLSRTYPTHNRSHLLWSNKVMGPFFKLITILIHCPCLIPHLRLPFNPIIGVGPMWKHPIVLPIKGNLQHRRARPLRFRGRQPHEGHDQFHQDQLPIRGS